MTTGTPATPARKVVVVRQGPPKRRGAFVDAIVGILGVALLVVAGVLGETLPDEEIIAAQYLPEFPTSPGTAQLFRAGAGNASDSVPLYLTDGQEERLEVVIPHDNVVSISLQVYLPGDDIGSSLPDSFTFKLLRPDGNPEGAAFKVNTKLPEQRDAPVPTLPIDPGAVANATGPLWISGESVSGTGWRLGAPPDPEYIGDGATQIEYTLALSQAIDKYTVSTNGTWTLVVQLTNAGDCPQPSPSGQNDRYQECTRVTSGSPPDPAKAGQDPGNAVTIKFVRYDYYTIELPDPKAESTDAI